MKIGIVGCGYVFDIYMRTFRAHPEIEIIGIYDIDTARLEQVSSYYSLKSFSSYESLLENSEIETILNLTSISSHYETTKSALILGKHVYSEKPLTTYLEKSAELFELAKRNKVLLFCAPCNLFSDSLQAIISAVRKGHIGDPLLIYAELDDNPIHLMNFEEVKSPSGAPWPLSDEIIAGCTYEHVGYHLVWICALLGPVVSLTAFSEELIENKGAEMSGKVGTPDFSTVCLRFHCGAVARVTCSVVAPRDHRIRVIGRTGELSSDGYRQFRAPVYLEKFSYKSLNARKLFFLRRFAFVGRFFGIGGKSVKLPRHSKSNAVEGDYRQNKSISDWFKEWLRRREVYAQDKFLGLAIMAKDIKNGSNVSLPDDFLLHINELTLLIQGAGREGLCIKPKTNFKKSSMDKSLAIFGKKFT